MRIVVIFILVTLLFSSCSDIRKERRKVVEKIIIDFQKNKLHWNSLKHQLLNDQYIDTHLGLLITPEQLNDSLGVQLTKEKILYVSLIKYDSCEEITINTDWTRYPIGALTLLWTPCDTNNIPRKGEYIDHFEKKIHRSMGIG